MSLSLYRKYRPETFTDVMGQEHIETTLRNAVRTNKISHAYLFCGPRGTGKTTTARLLAKALLCEKAPTEHPDGTCEQCREIADGIHPDVYELDAASRTGVENVREEIIGRVQFAPTRGAYKIYIIDEVHMLSTAAFNALLKTLEEPPTHVLFVLCTTDPHKVPETIQSRCQRFDFHRLSEEQITERLAHISEREGYTVQPEALALIATRSRGGMRDAISSLEQIAVFGAGTVNFEAAESMLGEVSNEQLFSVAALIAQRNVAACFAWVASFTQSGTDIAQFVRDLSGHVRNVYVAAVLGNDSALAEIVEADDEQATRYLEQAALFDSSERLANILVVLGDLSKQLRSAADARLALEIALTRMARPDSDLTLEALAARVAMLERQVSSGTLSATATAPVVTGTGTAKARPAAVAKARPVTAAAAVAATEAPAAAKAVETTARPTMEAVAEVSAVKTPSTEVAEATETTEVTAHPTAEATEVTRPSTEVAEATPAVERVSTASADERVVPVADVVTAVEQDQPSAADAATGEQETPDSQRGSLTSEAARHLWLQLEKELAKAKKRSLVTLLGGSSAHLDPKTGGLLIELPNNASFAKQNLERQDNTSLLASLIERLHGTALPFVFVLGREKAAPLQTEPSPAEPSPAEQPPAEQPAAEPPQTEPLPQTEPSPDESTQADSASAQAVENGKSEEEPSLEDIFSASFGTGVAIHEVKD